MKFSLIFVLFLFFLQEANAACPRYAWPKNQKMFANPEPWGTDTGIIIDGFLEFEMDGDGSAEVLHGVDLSAYNNPNYKALSECGATFAFLKLDKKYASHSDSLIQFKSKVFPYFYMNLADEELTTRCTDAKGRFNRKCTGIQTRSLYASALTADQARLFERIGEFQAQKATASISRIKMDTLPTLEVQGKSYAIIALDVEEKLIDESKSTPEMRYRFGEQYAVAVCTWTRHIREKFGEVIVLLYTTPTVYADYLIHGVRGKGSCVSQLPVWLARTTPTGGDVHCYGDGIHKCGSKRTKSVRRNDEYSQTTCNSEKKNRCVIHQYTHRGFLGVEKKRQKKGNNVDVNRMFPISFEQATQSESLAIAGLKFFRQN